MIEMICGLPGAGKGVYSTIRVIEELRNSDRPIITNFALELRPWIRRLGRRRTRAEKGLRQHLLDEYGEDYDVLNRVHILDDAEIAKFYEWRVDENKKLIQINVHRDKDGTISKIDELQWSSTQPCLYLIDEAWKFYGSRNWQKNDKGFQFYNAQHRKASDDLIITVQTAGQVDKQLRALVQQYHSLVNHKHRKVFIFKQPNIISVVHSNEPPDGNKSTLTAMPKIIKFTSDGIGSCFDTAKGAGVQGQGADIERKTKGLPWWGIILMVIGIGFLIVMAARGMGYFAGKLLTGSAVGQQTSKAVNQIATPQWGTALGGKPETNVNVDPGQPERKQKSLEVEKIPDPVYMVGVSLVPGYWKGQILVQPKAYVMLSDGRMIESPNSRMALLTKEYCVYDGKTNWTKNAYPY